MQVFRRSTVWVVDFHFDGRPRRWFKALPPDVDAVAEMTRTLRALYGDRARLLSVHEASEDEERQYVRGEVPRNVYCPTGRR